MKRIQANLAIPIKTDRAGAALWVIFVLAISGAALAVDPAIDNPAGRSPTVPPTHYRSGLVRSPNPVDKTGNLIVTGNVAGGKHFRGVVPYNAISDFSGRVGSTRLDNFLRRSAGSQHYNPYLGKTTPFYSPTRTVATIRPGDRKVFRPDSSDITAPDQDTYKLPRVSQDTTTLRRQREGLQYRPMGFQPEEFERIMNEQRPLVPKYIEQTEQEQKQAEKKFSEQMQKLKQDLEVVNQKTKELKQSLVKEDKATDFITEKRRAEQDEQLETKEEDILELRGETPDVFEQMREQLNELREQMEAEALEQKKPATEEYTEKPSTLLETLKTDKRSQGRYPEGQEKTTTGKTALEELEELSDLEFSLRAQRILREHKSFAAYSKDKFNQYVQSAELYLKQGQYYKAADAYTMANIYKPNDPLAFAGKSHALFAAGEYMSSALFLSRALEIFPEYALFKVDVVSMIGDKDVVDSSMAEVKLWAGYNDAPELSFILAYFYYQMDMLEQAKESIDTAYEKMPDSKAVAILKKAIDKTAGK